MFWGDILDGHDSTMNYEYDDAWKADDTKMWSFKVKSGAGDASLAAGQDIVKDGKGGYNCKHKTTLKTKLADEWEGSLITSNKEHEVELEWKPTDMNKDGQQVKVELEAKCLPAANKWSTEVEVKAGGFDLGAVKPWTTLKFATDDKLAHTFDYTQNMVFDGQYHAAWKVCMNQDFALTSAYGVLAMIGANGNYYLRGDKTKFLGMGTWFKNDWGSHSMEVQYDASKNNTGMFGQPLFLRYGGKFQVGAVSHHTSFLWGQKLMWKDKTDFKVGDNMKLSVTGYYDIMDALTKGETANIKLGVASELKL